MSRNGHMQVCDTVLQKSKTLWRNNKVIGRTVDALALTGDEGRDKLR